MKTARGIALSVVGVGVLCVWIGSVVWSKTMSPPLDHDVALSVGPVFVLAAFLLNLTTAAGERAVTFSPAEIDFLFPGPFTRRNLLVYKLVKTGLTTILSSMVFGLVLARYGGNFGGRFVGAWITLIFFQLCAMTMTLAGSIAGERYISQSRRYLLMIVAAAGVAMFAPKLLHRQPTDYVQFAKSVRQSTAGRVILRPFSVFSDVILSEHVADAIRPVSIGLATIGVLVAVVLRLDGNYLETAAAATARRYERLGRFRRGGLAGMSKPAGARWRLPPLPFLAGAGPIIWRQLTSVLRTARGLVTVMAVVAVVAGVAVAKSDDADKLSGGLVGMTVWANLFLVSMLKFDFRGDVDHIDVLRSLPLRPTAVAAAQLVAPTVVLSAAQCLLFIALASWGHVPLRWLLAGVAFVIPFNAVLVGTENLVFLIFPTKQAATVAGDMGMVGRQTIIFLARLVILLLIGSAAAGLGLAVKFLLHNPAATAAAAWLPLAGAVVLIVWLMALLFERFDPSLDTPT